LLDGPRGVRENGAVENVFFEVAALAALQVVRSEPLLP
jgi:hypothetical protein